MKLRSLIATGMLLLSIMSASAKVELPVTQVNGKPCYCYTVGRQQTLYSVADELGLSRDEIVKYNPAANDGVKKGQVLYFPVDKFPDLGNSSAATDAVNGTYTVKKGDSFYGICYKLGVSSDALLAANPSIASGVKVGQELKIPSEAIQQEISDESLNNQNDQRLSLTPVRPVIVPIDTTDNPDAVEQAADRSASIVAMLPFMLNSKESDKHALIATDFYKGMLLAADSLKNKSGQINIYAFDTEGSTERVRNFCQSDTFRNASVIIAPDDPEQLALIASHASGNQYVFNAFIVKDNSYTTNPHMLQSYIPSDA
ncbi:MAG: LysM peptidoglycan-binding domain-containing protein, partial [Muribaculaceae bacterium]|nr:LysM peptidoglycan-binding domain-containing protein [Muribaculaceae bacterium]